jgi:hypothetical protein
MTGKQFGVHSKHECFAGKNQPKMHPTIKKMKKCFEVWIVLQLGDKIRKELLSFDLEDGYTDQIVNAMWVGFNGGSSFGV